VEAGLATAFALTKKRPAAVLHVGIAGARTLEPPAVVIGSESVYRDLTGLSGDLPRTERALPDATLLETAKRVLPEAHVLPICTSARVGGASDCDVEAMEGFAVLRAAELAGVPALELRAISNAFDVADRSRWQFDAALEAVADATKRLLAELS
jgi:nucleoside phosphorylase